MPAHSRLCLPLLAALLLGVAGARAQQPASTTLHVRQGPRSRTISLDVVVTRKPGEPVAGLEEKDFTLLDDKKPREITSFRAFDGSQEPVEVVLLIDSVNTNFSVIARVRIEIDRFLRANGGALARPMTLAVLTNKGIQMQVAYSRDGNLLAAALDKYTIGLRVIGRSAGIEGASERLGDSLKALKTLATYESTRPGRKIILWVSPGWPLLSGPEVELSQKEQEGVFSDVTWISTELQESQTTVDSVNPLGVDESVANAFYYEQFLDGVKKPSGASMGNLGLQVIANETGGLVLSSSEISGLLRQCVADTGAYYRISFEPPPTEHRDVYHALKVKVGEPGLTARTSTGYYAEP